MLDQHCLPSVICFFAERKQVFKFFDVSGKDDLLSITVLHCLINPPAEDSITSTLVGGFNPSEKYASKWESSPNRGENKKMFETTISNTLHQSLAADLSKLPFIFSPELAACSCDDAPRYPLSCYLTGNEETLTTNLQSVRRTCSNQYECLLKGNPFGSNPPHPV